MTKTLSVEEGKRVYLFKGESHKREKLITRTWPEIKQERKRVRVGGGGFIPEWRPLQESNLQLALRRGSLYPFN